MINMLRNNCVTEGFICLNLFILITIKYPCVVGCLRDIAINGDYVLPADNRMNVPGTLSEASSRCERVIQCDSHTCNEHGTCTDLWVDFSCECERPYYGNNCTQSEYRQECWSGGMIMDW